MKILWMWAFIALFFTVGALRFVFNGQLPNKVEPQRIMNVSDFQTPEQLGAVIYRRFWPEMQRESIVVLLSSPFLRDYDKVWRGLLTVAQQTQHPFTRIYEIEGLRNLTSKSSTYVLSEALNDLKNGERVLLHAVATDQMYHELKKNLKTGLYILQQPLPIDENERIAAQQLCDQSNLLVRESERAVNQPQTLRQLEPFSCLALNAMKRGRKKKFMPNAYVSAIEKFAADSHLVYVHEPPSHEGPAVKNSSEPIK
jgi:hypothetical protein